MQIYIAVQLTLYFMLVLGIYTRLENSVIFVPNIVPFLYFIMRTKADNSQRCIYLRREVLGCAYLLDPINKTPKKYNVP